MQHIFRKFICWNFTIHCCANFHYFSRSHPWQLFLDKIVFNLLFLEQNIKNLPKSPTFFGNFCKGFKIYHFLVKSFLGNFYRHLAIFSGHTDYDNKLRFTNSPWEPFSMDSNTQNDPWVGVMSLEIVTWRQNVLAPKG